MMGEGKTKRVGERRGEKEREIEGVEYKKTLESEISIILYHNWGKNSAVNYIYLEHGNIFFQEKH